MTEFDLSSNLYDYRYAIGNLAGREMSVLFVIKPIASGPCLES